MNQRNLGCLTSVRPTNSCARALTYLLSIYLHSWLLAYKTGNISETVEDRAKATATINGLYKLVQWLSIAAKMTSKRDSRSLIPQILQKWRNTV